MTAYLLKDYKEYLYIKKYACLTAGPFKINSGGDKVV